MPIINDIYRGLAEKIAQRLFTTGDGIRATRLELKLADHDYAGENTLGGWCFTAAATQIQEVLRAESTASPAIIRRSRFPQNYAGRSEDGSSKWTMSLAHATRLPTLEAQSVIDEMAEAGEHVWAEIYPKKITSNTVND